MKITVTSNLLRNSMEQTPEKKPLLHNFDSRSVVNFSKYSASPSDPKETRPEIRVIACWIHVPRGSTLGGRNNRVFMMGFPDDYTELWTIADQRLLNREYWEFGCESFGVEPETLYPVDISLWAALSAVCSGFKVTFFDSRSPVGLIEGERIYDSISINGLKARYVGRSSGIDASGPEDLLIPTKVQDGYFLHYKIQGKFTIQDWSAISTEGEMFSCSELLFGLAQYSAH